MANIHCFWHMKELENFNVWVFILHKDIIGHIFKTLITMISGFNEVEDSELGR